MSAARAVPNLISSVDDSRSAILQELETAARRPTELLELLGDRFSDFQVKDALLSLLRDGEVVLTSDRHLKRSAT